MIVRRETTADRAAVAAVHAAAFATPGGGTPAEVGLVDALRDDGDAIPALSLVATVGDVVVGHVLGSRGRLGDRPSVGLGPLGVQPEHQRRSVGQALMHAVLGAADALGESELFLLGDPAYYRRFGFVLAAPLGLLPPDPAWSAHFQVRPLAARDPSARGTFRYAAAFDRL
jgi:putative acetyltransferase